MELTDNIREVTLGLIVKLNQLNNPETVTRAAALAVLPELRERIHVEGKAADGSTIGEYSNSYLRLRQKKYNRTADRTVVESLTRQLENSYTLQPTQNGYGIGFTTPLSFDKVKWQEEKYGSIWKLTESEINIAILAAESEANKLLQS